MHQYSFTTNRMATTDVDTFYPKDRQQWRKWLAKNHQRKDSIWLVCYKKEAGTPTITWSDAVDEALCFGWIDSQRKPVDDKKFIQRFSKRKATSMWSKINKQKVKQLAKAGLMAEAGFEAIAVAKRNGSWSILDEVEELIIPTDLEKAFRKKRGSKKQFQNLSRSKKRLMLVGLVMAKSEITRARRVNEIIETLAEH
jgi:uncharacterized protein YdeI (YjbR/CyaY-like superfamily)